jgi:hypothetical protein
VPRPSSPRVLAVALAGVALAAAPAAGQTVSVDVSPAYREGETGANGWFNRAVLARYRCDGDGVVSCPPNERFADGAGVAGPIVRTATFAGGPVSVVVESAPGVPLRVDNADPALPVVTTPAASGDGPRPVYDAGSDVRAAFVCDFTGDASGPSPLNPCTATVERRPGTLASGDRLDTGAPDQPATWGARTLRVVAVDAAGNLSTRRVTYEVDELPGYPGVVSPVSGQVVGPRPVLRWTAPADDGSGFRLYRVRVTSAAGVRVYEVGDRGAAVEFPLPDELPLGQATWNVTYVDVRGRAGETAPRTFTVADRPPPPAPRVTTAPLTTGDPRPLFAWEPGEAGGTFEWQLVSGGQVVQSGTTAEATLRPPAALGSGPYAFRVRQVGVTGIAGPWSPDAGFTVLAAPAAPPPSRGGAVTRFVPATINAARLRPRAGTRVTPRPTLTWPRVRGATLYNVQLFRLDGRRFTKVHSAFPRANRYRVPARKLKPGKRYVFRVWPYVGRTGRYARRPVGTSWFDVRPVTRR